MTGREFDPIPEHVCDAIIGKSKKDVRKSWEVEIRFQLTPFSTWGFF
jgi:hypothetical protein